MAGNPEVRRRSLETYKNFNKFTHAGALGVAILVPALAVPALTLAAVDGAQIIAINEFNKKKSGPVAMKQGQEYRLAA